MVYLNRIYTRSGDAGETSLGDGARIPKTHPRIVAIGAVDELNSLLGAAAAAGLPDGMPTCMAHIQNDLFDVGADLCVPESTEAAKPPLRITSDQVAQLERWIDGFNESLAPLTSFVLPGGSLAAAQVHHARTVCRRVEISVLELAACETINPQIAIYLNRLSDLLFVLARVCNDNGRTDVLWVPGRSQTT